MTKIINLLGLFTAGQVDELMQMQDIKREVYTKNAYEHGLNDAKGIHTTSNIEIDLREALSNFKCEL